MVFFFFFCVLFVHQHSIKGTQELHWSIVKNDIKDSEEISSF